MQHILKILALRMTPFKAYSLTHALIVCAVVFFAWGLALLLAHMGAAHDAAYTAGYLAHEGAAHDAAHAAGHLAHEGAASESAMKHSRRKYTYKYNFTDLLLLSCGILLLLMEILKQLLLTYVRGGSYSWSDFPFQLCSVPMYLCLIYPFAGSRMKNAIRQFLMTFGLIGAVAALAVPYSSFYSYVLLTVQSLLWHGILLFLALYLCHAQARDLKSKEPLILRSQESKRKLSNLPVGAMLLYLVAATIAVGFNLIFYQISAGTMNMFFFGPGYPDVFILNDIYGRYGWIVETLGMMIMSELAAGLIWNFIKPGRKNEYTQ